MLLSARLFSVALSKGEGVSAKNKAKENNEKKIFCTYNSWSSGLLCFSSYLLLLTTWVDFCPSYLAIFLPVQLLNTSLFWKKALFIFFSFFFSFCGMWMAKFSSPLSRFNEITKFSSLYLGSTTEGKTTLIHSEVNQATECRKVKGGISS